MTTNIIIENTTTENTITAHTTTANDTPKETIIVLDNDVKVVDKNLLYNDCNNHYYYDYYNNTNTTHHNFIVIEYGYDGEYVDSLLMNVDLYDLLKQEHKDNFNFENLYNDLENYNMFVLNGFLGVHYKANDIEHFIDKYEKYFFTGFRTYIMSLYNKIDKEVEIREKVGELFLYK